MEYNFAVQPTSCSSSAPSSPSGSISSLPSVSSSYFFSSSSAPSPPHPPLDSAHTQRLIIPSLALPEPLRAPSLYGKTIGDIRLLLIAGPGADVSSVLFQDNQDVVDITPWEETDHGNVLRASTDWIEHTDPHGLHKFEPARNVEITKLPATTTSHDLSSLVHSPFSALSELIDPHCPPSAALANLIASPWTPLYTALIIFSNSDDASSPEYNGLLDALAPHIPIIILPHSSSPPRPRPHMSSFLPATPAALRAGLFRSPETLSTLRYEAAERFLRWREVERAVEGIREHDLKEIRAPSFFIPSKNDNKSDEENKKWDKAKWEAEWESRLSQDVARSRKNTITNRSRSRARSPTHTGPCFDPLHVSSLLVLSMSLLEPLRKFLLEPAGERLGNVLSLCRKSMSSFISSGDNPTPASSYTARSFSSLTADPQVRMAMVSSLCIGIGIGLFFRS
ncbi:hypothetical protein BV22DRAFT_1110246 [Leucogyrophana mollusca]|uniref:Uncharacterized protein n=1 Tax=Leucogyrophana mollusca TaxID=85980 RepID=A0ACB8BTK9_9AGAM|nr:hypothetical protein BV22DRAFT_1110246 [Leucogyrophana mollusca]